MPIAKAARVLSPGGILLVVDFAAHECEELRVSDAHIRLGFDDEVMAGWFAAAGLAVDHVEHHERPDEQGADEEVAAAVEGQRAHHRAQRADDGDGVGGDAEPDELSDQRSGQPPPGRAGEQGAGEETGHGGPHLSRRAGGGRSPYRRVPGPRRTGPGGQDRARRSAGPVPRRCRGAIRR